MRVPERESIGEGRERLTVVPETIDDLWHLSHVVEPGDRVAGDTTRRIQRNDDRLRDTGGEREHLHVTIAVETVEFHRFANRLRIGGEIVACSREDQLGHHHTLNVEETTELTIEKRLKPDQEQRLEEAVAATEEPDVAVATVEEGAAWIHTVAQFGVEEYAAFTDTTGKGEYARGRSELFESLAEALTHVDVDAVILAGPGFTKNDAYEYLEREVPDVAEIVTVVDTSAAGERGVHEVLKRGAIEDVRAQARVAREAALIDELTDRIAAGVEASYGPEPVAEAAEYGAVETLLILDDALRRERSGDGEWAVDADEILERVEQQGGDVTVFSADFAPGQQLRNLGEIAALLRYRLE